MLATSTSWSSLEENVISQIINTSYQKLPFGSGDNAFSGLNFASFELGLRVGTLQQEEVMCPAFTNPLYY